MNLRNKLISTLREKLEDIHSVKSFKFVWKEKTSSTLLMMWPDRGTFELQPTEEFIVIRFQYTLVNEDDGLNLLTDSYSVYIETSSSKFQDSILIGDTVTCPENIISRFIVFWGSKNNIWKKYVSF